MLHTAVTVATAAAEAAEQSESFPPELLGILAFGGLAFALLVTWAFRNVSNRH